jgi:hypothetical protein
MKYPCLWVTSPKMSLALLGITEIETPPFLNQPKLVELETTKGNYVLNLEKAVVYWPSKNTRQR